MVGYCILPGFNQIDLNDEPANTSLVAYAAIALRPLALPVTAVLQRSLLPACIFLDLP